VEARARILNISARCSTTVPGSIAVDLPSLPSDTAAVADGRADGDPPVTIVLSATPPILL
jgi:hypothetical protein